MTDAQENAGSARGSAPIDTICDAIRRGLEAFAEAITPPESACKHFRESRIEFLRGIREIIDHRIDTLSKTKGGGTRVVVE